MATCDTKARNVIIGAAELFEAPCNEDYLDIGPDGDSLVTAGDSIRDYYNQNIEGSAWHALGYTQEGVEVAYTPDIGEVEVDQLKDAAVLFNQGVTVTMNTNLAEATLRNLAVAWGQDADVLSEEDGTETFKIAVPPSMVPERKLVVVGTGTPRVWESDVTLSGNQEVRERERVYRAHRVISVEGSNHSLRRTEATIYPVSFRLLPSSDFPGAEYGSITDRLLGTAPELAP